MQRYKKFFILPTYSPHYFYFIFFCFIVKLVILLIINTLALKTFLSIIKQNIKKGCVAHPRYIYKSRSCEVFHSSFFLFMKNCVATLLSNRKYDIA
jgi:hypothetical protein